MELPDRSRTHLNREVISGPFLSARSWPGAIPMLVVAAALALRISMDAGAALAVIFKYMRQTRPGECEVRNDR